MRRVGVLGGGGVGRGVLGQLQRLAGIDPTLIDPTGGRRELDAVVLASPADTHTAPARHFLRRGTPVVFDMAHSTQLPGAAGDRSGGQRLFAAVLARAAVGAGVAGLFCEVHPDPAAALCDSEIQLTPAQLAGTPAR